LETVVGAAGENLQSKHDFSWWQVFPAGQIAEQDAVACFGVVPVMKEHSRSL